MKIFTVLIGLFISSFGTALFYKGAIGSGAMATFCDGLHLVVNISYGQANMLMNGIFLIFLFLLGRKFINIGTVLCVFCIGIFVDAATWMLGGVAIADGNFLLRLVFALLGTVMMGAGLGLYVAVDIGFGALEGLVKVFVAKTGLPFGKIKIAQDVLLVAGGILMGAKWGVGTLISAVLIGPIMQQSIAYFQRHLRFLQIEKQVSGQQMDEAEQIGAKQIG